MFTTIFGYGPGSGTLELRIHNMLLGVTVSFQLLPVLFIYKHIDAIQVLSNYRYRMQAVLEVKHYLASELFVNFIKNVFLTTGIGSALRYESAHRLSGYHLH
jgi:hypothetical protein